jgi:Protein of unknown function with PCYCGC motif
MPAAQKRAVQKSAFQRVSAGFLFVALIVVLLALPQHAATPAARSAQGPPAPGMDMSLPTGQEPIPAYHKQLPSSPLPATLDPQLFVSTIVQNAYTLAAGIRKLLYQQPCYCHCDQSQGHGSLLDCFAGKHGSNCNVCMAEDFYTYEQSRKGKTAAQIRAGIIAGEWKSVDLVKYQQPLPAK